MTPETISWPLERSKTVIDGRFRIRNPLAIGGMGHVYDVDDLDLECISVLKHLRPNLHPSDPRVRERKQPDARHLLVNEAKTQAKLARKSDAFIHVFHRGTAYVSYPIAAGGDSRTHVTLDLPYYVMERLHGDNFETLIDAYRKNKQPMDWDVVFKLAAQSARALAVAHSMDIVHRDIKPNNLFVHERNEGKARVTIIDFGVSTKHGERGVLGSSTQKYGAPELLVQSEIRPAENKQSDLYPLGIVLYELATGLHPFAEWLNAWPVVGSDAEKARSRGYSSVAYANIHVQPPPLSTRRADTPPAYEKLVMALLAKKGEDRPNVEEFLKELLRSVKEDPGQDDDQLAGVLSSVRPRRAARPAPNGGRGKGQSVSISSGQLTDPPVVQATTAKSEIFFSQSVPPVPISPSSAPALVGERTKPFGPVAAPQPATPQPQTSPSSAPALVVERTKPFEPVATPPQTDVVAAPTAPIVILAGSSTSLPDDSKPPATIVAATALETSGNASSTPASAHVPSTPTTLQTISRAALVHDTEPDGEPLFPELMDGEPEFAELTDPLPATAILADDELRDVRVFSSMASAFHWNETSYRDPSSPLGTGGEGTSGPPRGPRPNSGPMPMTKPTPKPSEDVGEPVAAPVEANARNEKRASIDRLAASDSGLVLPAEEAAALVPSSRERRARARRRVLLQRSAWLAATALVVAAGYLVIVSQLPRRDQPPPVVVAMPAAAVAPPASSPTESPSLHGDDVARALPASLDASPPAPMAVAPSPAPQTTPSSAVRATRATPRSAPRPAKRPEADIFRGDIDDGPRLHDHLEDEVNARSSSAPATTGSAALPAYSNWLARPTTDAGAL